MCAGGKNGTHNEILNVMLPGRNWSVGSFISPLMWHGVNMHSTKPVTYDVLSELGLTLKPSGIFLLGGGSFYLCWQKKTSLACDTVPCWLEKYPAVLLSKISFGQYGHGDQTKQMAQTESLTTFLMVGKPKERDSLSNKLWNAFLYIGDSKMVTRVQKTGEALISCGERMQGERPKNVCYLHHRHQ